MHEMSSNFLIQTFIDKIQTFIDKIQTFIDKIQTEKLRVKNSNSLDKIQYYGNAVVRLFYKIPWDFGQFRGACATGSGLLEDQWYFGFSTLDKVLC